MSRRDARDIAFKLIFAYTFDKEKNDDAMAEYVAGLEADDEAYIKEVYNGVILHYNELVELVASKAEKFEIERIYKVDLAILLLSLYEINYILSIPFKVATNEALNLAHKYSTEKSSKFINGILSKFAR